VKQLYCISGFGADERVFSKLTLQDCEIHFLPWLIPHKKESLTDYARRMADQIMHENPVLVGLSFGGMICIEIAKILPARAVILISSFKTLKELPPWMRWSGVLKLHRILPLRSFRLIEPIENFNLGLETKEEKELATDYRKNVNYQYTSWAINTILNWRNRWKPEKLFHIHGKKDRLIPIRNVIADVIIPTGGHMMIMNRADEVSASINKLLATL
jgi:pimeloyl-ACP methyl ester carboxylesterase